MGQNYDHAIEALHNMDASPSKDALWSVFTRFMQSRGANLISYHHIPPAFAPDHNQFQIMAEGFAEDWVTLYDEKKMHFYDPVTQLARYRLNAFWWSDVENLVQVTPQQKDYLKDLYRWLKGDGLAVPAFGPSGRNGYFGLGRKEARPDWDKNDERALYWSCQAFHHRFCELQMKDLPKDFTLTKRESQILRWLAKGYSEEMICGLVNAQLESVKSAIEKTMRKMGVSDRASMLLRASACGIIEG